MNPDVVFNNREIVDPERFMEHYLRGDLSGEDEVNFLQYMKAELYKKLWRQKCREIMSSNCSVQLCSMGIV